MKTLLYGEILMQNSFNLFEAVKSRENNVVSSPDKTDSRQQLQHKGFGPVAAEEG